MDDPKLEENTVGRDGPGKHTDVGGIADQLPFTDAPSPIDDHVSRGGDGEYEIDPLGLDDAGESRSFDGGDVIMSAKVKSTFVSADEAFGR